MREFISLLISPLPILYIILLIALIFRIVGRTRRGKSRHTSTLSRYLLIMAVIWFLVISTRPVPYLLVNNLEKQYRQLTDAEINNIPDSVNILVLGGGYTDDAGLTPNNQLMPTLLARLSEGIRIHNMIPGSTLVTSGAGHRRSFSAAEVMYRTALILGVDSSNLRFSRFPRNTNSEAEYYLQIFGKDKKLVLVTSATHMPRSVMLFRSKGLDVIPAPADFIIRHPSKKYPWHWLPMAEHTEMLERAVHEYGGILWFKIGGW